MKKTATINTLPAIVAAVLSGAVKDTVEKDAKKSLAQNLQAEGEIVVRIPYRVTKGEDYDTAPTVNLLSKAVLAKALVYSGVTAAAYEKALLKAAKEAFENGDKVGDTILAQDADRVAESIIEIQERVVSQLPRQHRTGVVKVDILTKDKQPEIVSHTTK